MRKLDCGHKVIGRTYSTESLHAQSFKLEKQAKIPKKFEITSPSIKIQEQTMQILLHNFCTLFGNPFHYFMFCPSSTIINHLKYA